MKNKNFILVLCSAILLLWTQSNRWPVNFSKKKIKDQELFKTNINTIKKETYQPVFFHKQEGYWSLHVASLDSKSIKS